MIRLTIIHVIDPIAGAITNICYGTSTGLLTDDYFSKGRVVMNWKHSIILVCTLLLFLSSNRSYGGEFIFSCVNDEKSFATTLLVDDVRETIIHKSSKNLRDNQNYYVDQYLNIIVWNYPIAIAMDRSGPANDVINFLVFDFGNETYSQSGHYIMERIQPNSQWFECVSSY